VRARATPGGFVLMAWMEDTREEWNSTETRWEFEGRTGVRLFEDCDVGCDITYLALSVDPQPIRDAIRLPDGSSAADAGAEIEIECGAVPLDSPPDFGRWRGLEISVSVGLKGYRRLQYRTTPANSGQVRTLRPRP